MSGWRLASVPRFSWVRGHASPQQSDHCRGLLTPISGFHDDATLTLSPSLTTAVVATIAASTLSLGVCVTIAVVSIRAVLSMPA
ncbi:MULTISPECIES: hypothetical protein [unclassified Bradyrhizobium]|uniref:hypothetical protein n=1 Tax=Bradyrhizobium TaxID=374 RepID=UPI002916EA5D|nr:MULTISPECIES: hypothetical protein [unclassified Bradyrhizobium]